MRAFVASMSFAKTTRAPRRSSARRTRPTPAKNSATRTGAGLTASLCRRETTRPGRADRPGRGNVSRTLSALLRVLQFVDELRGLLARLGVLPLLRHGFEDRDLLLRHVLAGGLRAGLVQRLRGVDFLLLRGVGEERLQRVGGLARRVEARVLRDQ